MEYDDSKAIDDDLGKILLSINQQNSMVSYEIKLFQVILIITSEISFELQISFLFFCYSMFIFKQPSFF